jgi:hypothetical protein
MREYKCNCGHVMRRPDTLRCECCGNVSSLVPAPGSPTTELETLLAENERMKRGDFTPDELQNLCHNLSEHDKEAFFKGWAAYQKKLFGCAHIEQLKDLLRRGLGTSPATLGDWKREVRREQPDLAG